MMKYLLFILITCCATCAHAGLFSKLTLSQHRLSHVSEDIKKLETNIEASSHQRDTLADKLQQDETQVATVQKKLQQVQTSLNKKSASLTQALSRRDHLVKKINAQKSLVNQHLIAAYMLGREPVLKLYLNQQNPEKIDRYITYYRYIIAARKKNIQAMQKNLTALHALSQKITQEQQALLSAQLQLEKQKRQLSQAQKNRQQTLHALNHRLSNQKNRLQQLKNDKAHLKALVKLLNQKNYYFTSGKNFAASRGLLPWPLKHFTTLQGYNTPIADGRMRSNGLLLKAPAGTPVHAIYPGQVVFAHWLRGYGFLTIIQHGKHYMTLYARTQALDVTTGQHVDPGQVIATVGNSGGYDQSALYFEIRYDSQAQNPKIWLRKRT